MKTSIERGFFNLAAKTILQYSGLLDEDPSILRVARHDVMMREKARGIFVDQDQTTKLNRLACLATLVKLRMRLEDAEQLFFVPHALALQDTTAGRVANLLGALDKQLDFSNVAHRANVEGGLLFGCFAQFLGAAQNLLGAIQQFAIGFLQPLFVVRSLA